MNALELTDVRHAFHGRLAVDGLSLVVAPGEVLAMIGLNGARPLRPCGCAPGGCGPRPVGRACWVSGRRGCPPRWLPGSGS